MSKKKIFHIINNLEFYIGVVLILAMLVLCTTNVILRAFFRTTLFFADEVCRWMLIWLTMLGASYAVVQQGHLYVDILYTVILKKHPLAIKIMKTLTAALWIAICAVCARYGMTITLASRESSAVTGLPRAIIWAAIPVCMILMALRVVQQTVLVWFPGKNEDSQEPIESGEEE